MAVTEYKPQSELGCGYYSYDKLDNVVYLVSQAHVKNVHIDNGEAYIDGLTEVPMRLEGFNIAFNEESSLDERYKFTKQVTFSLHSYVPHNTFEGKYYVILKSKDGTKWMVNVDFPSKVTYTFNLNEQQYQTDFTFSSVSNFPTLRLATDIGEGELVCKELRTFGLDYLRMLETYYCKLDAANETVYTYGKDFVDVEYLGKSLSLQEAFDGENLTTTLSFDIAFDAYKSSWHYTLLEFLRNSYSAIIKPKGTDEALFSGFHFGLQPSFNVSTSSQLGNSDVITVTLIETSVGGSKTLTEWTEEEDEDTYWQYVRRVGDIIAYECVELGIARFLLQQEVNTIGHPTGRYLAFTGYTSQFPTLNIIGEFDQEYRFPNSDCGGDNCAVMTDLPSVINYETATCNTYSYSASCDWEVSNLASYMTVTPSSGNGGYSYSLSVCNTKTPTTNESSTFDITAGNNITVVNVNLLVDGGILNPSSVDITCLAQNVKFNFDPNCPIDVTSIDPSLTYQITYSQLIVQVPRNYSIESGITWSIGVIDCNDETQTVVINQDKTYERWVDTSGYLCSGSTSYARQQRYTGTTSSDINTPTSEYRMGAKIQDQDPRCGSYETKWEESSDYVCIDGDKWSFEEEYIKYEGGTWQKTGNTRLKALVEADSEDCQETVEYKWVLTDQWQCYGGEVPIPTYRWYPSGTTCVGYDKWEQSIRQVSYDSGTTWSNVVPTEYSATTLIEVNSVDCGYVPPTFDGKFKAEYSDSTTYSAACDSSTELSSATTRAHSTSYTAMTDAEIGDCVTTIDDWAFYYCTSLTSCTIGNSVETIGKDAFANCVSLSSITIPNSVTSIGNYVFYQCSGLTSIEIPSGVTSIGNGAFDYCYSLTSVTIPDSVTSIGDNAFNGCKSLTNITIPDSVTNIGEQAFMWCSGLTSIEIPSGVTSIGNGVFYACKSLRSIDMPSGVTSIGITAFQACTSLTSIDIPSGVTSIGEYAFIHCSSLTSITVNATTPPTLGTSAFNYTNSAPIYVPSESVNAYKTAWSDYASRIQAIP